MINICRPFITKRDGTILYASAYGLQAFCFSVDTEWLLFYLQNMKRKQKTPLNYFSNNFLYFLPISSNVFCREEEWYS